MKMIHKIKNIAFLALAIFMAACESFLEEEPNSLLTAKYLETEGGVNSALNATYSYLRFFYGGEGGMSVTCAGTDEWQKGPDGNANINTYSQSMSTEGLLLNTWDWGYTAINTANAVLKFADGSGMKASDIAQVKAEAKYLRATWYFMMVQTYGDCPLNKEFQSTPSTVAFRDPADSVYAFVIKDLEEAKVVLSNSPVQPGTSTSSPGRATKAAAYHLLAKVYLTRATRATTKISTDYENAYKNSTELIKNASTYGLALLKDFKDVFTPGNEYNTEVIFRVERNATLAYNDNNPNLDQGLKNNRSSFFFRPNYSTWVDGLKRTIKYGRPWHRIRPTNYLLEEVFKDRVNDSRYAGTFQTVWLVNDPANLKNLNFKENDTAVYMPGYETYKPVKALKIYTPSQYYGNTMGGGTVQTLSIYPSMSKFDDNARPDVADASIRPFIVHRFAETYLIAAEAAMYTNRPAEAREYLNVVRRRAAFSVGRSDAQVADAISKMETQVPSMTDFEVGISFILDERSRELAGEYMRWWDLARTRRASGMSQLEYRLNNLTPAVPAKGNVKYWHVVRPIPVDTQIDLLTNKEDFPQNEGYGAN
jgi:hypothetical protein